MYIGSRKGETDMEEKEFGIKLKIKLMIYIVITEISFSYLILPERAGISVFVFALLQTVMMWFLVGNRKKLLWMIPIGILCLNSFLSMNTMWRGANFVVCALLFVVMFTDLRFKDTSMGFLGEMAGRALLPVDTAAEPVVWAMEMTEGKKGIAKRVVIGVLLSLLAMGFLSVVLSSADMVFSKSVGRIFINLFSLINLSSGLKIILGIAVALFLFGIVVGSHFNFEKDFEVKKERRGDLLITGIVMVSILAVYTAFVFIQFRYLFSGSTLPYGLDVWEYARKGFFELLGLSCVNITIILVVVRLAQKAEGKMRAFVKFLNLYLCFVTVVLLTSSFYRMWLYSESDGLTRLRFMVFGFLIFEFIGLIFTFIYIVKPKFNIVLVYGAIGLLYYLILNVIPMDAIVAKNQVDRFLNGEREEITYVRSLSGDAAGEIVRAYEKGGNVRSADVWMKRKLEKREEGDWRSFNLSEYKIKKLLDN